MVYGRYNYNKLMLMGFINQLTTGGAPSCMESPIFSDFVGISPQKRLVPGLTILGAFLPCGKLTMENGKMEVLMENHRKWL